MRLYNPQRHEMPIRLPRGEDCDVKVRPYSSIQLFPGEESRISESGVWVLLEDDEPNPPRPDQAPRKAPVYVAVSADMQVTIKGLSKDELTVIRTLSEEQLFAIHG